MHSTDELTLLRRRVERLAERLERLDGPDRPSAGSTTLARVVDLGSKSSAARSVVAVVPVQVEVDPVEGAVPVLTPAPDSEAFLALNLGSTTPPVGLDVLVETVDGLPVLRHEC